MNNKMKSTCFLAQAAQEIQVTQGKAGMQKLLCFGILCAASLSVSAVAAELQSYDKLAKQLTIMNNIFTSSLQAQEDKTLKNTKISSLYLSGQGIVFIVKSSERFTWNSHGFGFNFSDDRSSSTSSSSDSSFEFFSHSDEKVEQMRLTNERQRAGAHQFREQQRELAANLRNLERDKRDLEYQLRTVSKDEKKTLVAEKKAITRQKAELEKVRVALKKKSVQMKQKQQTQQDKRLENRKDYYQKLAISLVDTLCTYGNSLKALPKGEYVNIVLKLAGDKVGRSYQDKILVLTKRDINACAMDKISTKKLLASAKNYQF